MSWCDGRRPAGYTETIPQFLAEYARGADVVYAIRRGPQGTLLLRCCYDSFYRIITALADIPLPLGAGTSA